MQLYPGAHLIECEFAARPLCLPLLIGEDEAVVVDSGAKRHATEDVPAYARKIGLTPDKLTWLIITHPDMDHCSGAAAMARGYPTLRIACGAQDRALAESPDSLFSFRYGRYGEEHNVFYDQAATAGTRQDCSEPQPVSLAFAGGESPRLNLF
jgi:glyoxylase-like metal-dependent hydrolase (beta-lactamase superfamily II)